MRKTSAKGKNINKFSKQRAHNLETIGGIQKKNAILLET